MECGIEQLTPSVESSNFLLRGCELPPLQNLNIVVCYGRSGLCELVCTHVTVVKIVHWNNPTNPKGGSLGRKVVGLFTIFRAVATPVPTVYPIPSHPMITRAAIMSILY